MIPKECKRLAEVDFPIAVVSAHSAREKSIRHGHPSTLHLWWARRPLAACRAMLLALLLPDPCDENCPLDFKDKARGLLGGFPGIVLEKHDLSLRRAILHFIGDVANWDNAAKPRYLEVGRGLVKAAHGEEAPLVVDPFAGGGSIPLEALRLGCDAFASDLNPVACLILKVMLEDIPRHGPELAEELRKVGAEIKKQAEKELSQYYPPDPDGATPIAYLWARTVRCESPNCSAEIPLVRSCWLRKKSDRPRALKFEVTRVNGNPPHIELEVYEPKTEKEVPPGTVARGNASCPACGRVLPVERVRVQLRQQRGGADTIFDAKGNRIGGARLIAVVITTDSGVRRQYRAASDRDYSPVFEAQRALAKLSEVASVIPDEPLRRVPVPFGVINVWVYGMDKWGDLFTSRQKLALATLSSRVRETPEALTRRSLALAVSRCADRNSALTRWDLSSENIGSTFGRQALPMVWDFAEVAPLAGASGDFTGALDWLVRVAEALPTCRAASTVRADARQTGLPDDCCDIWFSDPPYYDAVPYSYISDFFYTWLARILRNDLPILFASSLTEKQSEIVAYVDESSDSGAAARNFERALADAFSEARRLLRDDGIGSVVFAHKTTEGWEALLEGIIKAGWEITSSWPVATEMGSRMRARESAALATSVHLVFRPRSFDAGTGDWAEVFRELPNRIGDWMERLSSEGVRGADLVFACIGPAMEVYSRYSRVEDAEGREIPLGGNPEAVEPHDRGFLAYVWEIVGRTALSQVLGTAEARARNGAAGALEEDARLTALFLWTVQSTSANVSDVSEQNGEADEVDDEDETGGTAKKGLTLIYDVVRRFSQPLGIHLENWEGRIIENKKGIVRLLPIRERSEALLGEDGASGVADVIERSRGGPINYQFGFMSKVEERAPKTNGKGRKRGKSTPDEAPTVAPGTTTLDRVHIAMLLQASGKSNALRTMLKAEVDRGPDFLRLANALSALYPRDSEEKRLLDAMLLAVPR
jgi:putative DNA methylase